MDQEENQVKPWGMFLLFNCQEIQKHVKEATRSIVLQCLYRKLMTAAQCPLLDESARHHKSFRQKVKCEDENKDPLSSKENV